MDENELRGRIVALRVAVIAESRGYPFPPGTTKCINAMEPVPVTLVELTQCISKAIAAGWHSEKIAKELCRQFGGQVLPKVE